MRHFKASTYCDSLLGTEYGVIYWRGKKRDMHNNKIPLQAPHSRMRITVNKPVKKNVIYPELTSNFITGKQAIGINSAPLSQGKVMMIYYIFHKLVKNFIYNISPKLSSESRWCWFCLCHSSGPQEGRNIAQREEMLDFYTWLLSIKDFYVKRQMGTIKVYYKKDTYQT